jgi:hypothetical protein
MSNKWAIGAVLLIGLLGIGFALHEHTVSVAAKAAFSAETREYLSSSAQLRQLTDQVNQAKGELAVLEAATAKGGAGRPGSATDAAGGNPSDDRARAARRGPPRDVNWELSSNPEVRESLSGWIKGTLNVAYGPLFKSMGMSAAQIESFENLVLKENINMGTAILTLRPQDETMAQVGDEMKAMLGPDNFQQFTQYQNTIFVREVSSGLAGSLFDTANPLSPQQAEQLTQILAQNSSLPPNSGPPFPGTIKWEGVLAQAQGLLSAPQLAALQNESTIISSQPGLWGALNPIIPGSVGNSAMPPGSFYSSPRPPPK